MKQNQKNFLSDLEKNIKKKDREIYVINFEKKSKPIRL